MSYAWEDISPLVDQIGQRFQQSVQMRQEAAPVSGDIQGGGPVTLDPEWLARLRADQQDAVQAMNPAARAGGGVGSVVSGDGSGGVGDVVGGGGEADQASAQLQAIQQAHDAAQLAAQEQQMKVRKAQENLQKIQAAAAQADAAAKYHALALKDALSSSTDPTNPLARTPAPPVTATPSDARILPDGTVVGRNDPRFFAADTNQLPPDYVNPAARWVTTPSTVPGTTTPPAANPNVNDWVSGGFGSGLSMNPTTPTLTGSTKPLQVSGPGTPSPTTTAPSSGGWTPPGSSSGDFAGYLNGQPITVGQAWPGSTPTPSPGLGTNPLARPGSTPSPGLGDNPLARGGRSIWP